MSMSVVKNIHPTLNKKQGEINSLERGGYAMPPDSFNKFSLAYEAEDLDLVDGGYIRNKWDMDVPNLLEDDTDEEKQDGRKKGNLSKSEAAAKLYEKTSYTQSKCAEIYDISTQAVNNEVS